MTQETAFGVFYIGLPEHLLVDLRSISEKTGKSIADCLSDAVKILKEQNDVH